MEILILCFIFRGYLEVSGIFGDESEGVEKQGAPTFGVTPNGRGTIGLSFALWPEWMFPELGRQGVHHRSFLGREARGLVGEAPGSCCKVLVAFEFHAECWRPDPRGQRVRALLWRRRRGQQRGKSLLLESGWTQCEPCFSWLSRLISLMLCSYICTMGLEFHL